MMNLPFEIDLKDKVAVVTGAGGVLCSLFAKAIARCGAKVALLDLNLEAAAKFAAEIAAEGGEAKAYAVNVLKKDTLLEAREQIRRDFGACDILVNGAGGNNPRATTTNEYYFDGDIEKDITTFFNLDPAGVEFVFNLNFLGTLIPTQVFAEDMLGKEDACILLHERLHSADQNPRLFGRQGRDSQFYPVAGRPLLQGAYPGQRHRPRLFRHRAEPGPAV